jgi:hypothetical protein
MDTSNSVDNVSLNASKLNRDREYRVSSTVNVFIYSIGIFDLSCFVLFARVSNDFFNALPIVSLYFYSSNLLITKILE